MQEAGDHPLFVEPGTPREIQHVDAVELVILALLDQLQNSVRNRRIGGLPQYRELRLDVAHAGTLDETAKAGTQGALNEA